MIRILLVLLTASLLVAAQTTTYTPGDFQSANPQLQDAQPVLF